MKQLLQRPSETKVHTKVVETEGSYRPRIRKESGKSIYTKEASRFVRDARTSSHSIGVWIRIACTPFMISQWLSAEIEEQVVGGAPPCCPNSLLLGLHQCHAVRLLHAAEQTKNAFLRRSPGPRVFLLGWGGVSVDSRLSSRCRSFGGFGLS